MLHPNYIQRWREMWDSPVDYLTLQPTWYQKISHSVRRALRQFYQVIVGKV